MQGQGTMTGHINCKMNGTREKQENVPGDYSRDHTEEVREQYADRKVLEHITHLIRHFKSLQQCHHLLLEVLLLQVKDIFT